MEKPLELLFLDSLIFSPSATEQLPLALFSALGIVKSFIRSDSANVIELDSELKQDFLQRGFLFPNPVHSDYLPWLLFILQECYQIGFNALSFSNILYLLETHTFNQLMIDKLNEKTSSS